MPDVYEAAGTAPRRRQQGLDECKSGPRQLITFTPGRECPLHFAMAQLAQAAVTQHVLYAQGEFTARPELMQALEVWLQLHELVRTRICPASRGTRLDQRWIDVQLDTILAARPAPLPAETQAALREMLLECVQRNPGEGCPLDREPVESLLGRDVEG